MKTRWTEFGVVILLVFALIQVFMERRPAPNWSYLWSLDFLVAGLIAIGGFGLIGWASTRGWIKQ